MRNIFLWILGAVLVLILGFAVFIKIMLFVETRGPKVDASYEYLLEICRERTSPNCCFASLSHISENNFAIGPDCPAGTSKNMLRCPSTLTWCEPNS